MVRMCSCEEFWKNKRRINFALEKQKNEKKKKKEEAKEVQNTTRRGWTFVSNVKNKLVKCEKLKFWRSGSSCILQQSQGHSSNYLKVHSFDDSK